MKNIKIILASLLFASAILVISCKKSSDKDNNPGDSNVSGANANALAENTSNDAIQIGAEAVDGSTSLNNYRLGYGSEETLSSCSSISVDSPSKTVTVTFNGSTCMDGRVRSGSIIYNFTGSPVGAHYRTPGFTVSISSSNYVVDGNQISINHSVHNTTPNNFNPLDTNETWHITGDVIIYTADGDTITWNCTRDKELLNTNDPTVYRGETLPIRWNQARVGLTGNASGRRKNGETFSVVVNSQLVRDFGSCRLGGKVPFIKGTLTYTPSNAKYPRIVDYGYMKNPPDVCDLWANVSINGYSFAMMLP